MHTSTLPTADPTSMAARPPAPSAAAAVGTPSGTRQVVMTQCTGLLLLLVTWRCCEPTATRAAAGAVGAAAPAVSSLELLPLGDNKGAASSAATPAARMRHRQASLSERGG